MPSAEHADVRSLCSVRVADRVFGLDSRRIVEVLGQRTLRKVPHAPAPVAGIVAHRGEVLTTLCLRRILGYDPQPGGESCVLMIASPRDQRSEPHPFGLLADEVGTLLSWRGEPVFNTDGLLNGLLFELDPRRLHEQPSAIDEVAA
jgi:chemotaxis signal transduction protein